MTVATVAQDPALGQIDRQIDLARSGRGFRGGSAAGPAAEQAAAEEGALQRAVSVHAPATEAGTLTGRVQAGDR
jgi:hypothetical protein